MSQTSDTPYRALRRHADRDPGKTMLVCNGRRTSYGEMLAEVDALGAAILDAGVAVGDRVAIDTRDKRTFILGFLAATAVGSVAVPLPDQAAAAAAVIADADPSLLIGGEEEIESHSSENNAAQLRRLPVAEASGATECLESWVADPNALAMLLYTSGSTSGQQRGVMITNRVLDVTAAYMNDTMSLDETVVEYVGAPIHHAFGLGRVRAVLRAGGTVVCHDGVFSPPRVLVALSRDGCNAVSSVSTGFALLIEHFAEDLGRVGANIRWAEIGSLPLAVPLKTRLLELLPHARLVMNYGLTEAMRSTFLDLHRDRTRLETVGRASPGQEIRVVDETGAQVPPDCSGEIEVHGQNLALGYWNRSDEWSARLHDGWFRTGDVGQIDRDGYLTYLGRLDDIINVGGYKVSPIEVEQLIRPHLGQTPYCVCGVPDPSGALGEVPALCVEGVIDVDLGSLRQALADKSNEHTFPRVVFRVESLPRTPNGKLRRNALRTQLIERMEEQETS